MTPKVKPAQSTPKVYGTKNEIMTAVAAHEISIEEGLALINQMSRPTGRVYCKVSQKGAVSVYGLQRMPVTLYVEQWERLLNKHRDMVLDFAHQYEKEEFLGESKYDDQGKQLSKPVPYKVRVTRKG